MKWLAFGALLLTAAADPAPRIFIASDSTAQDYKPERYPQSGWGTMLRCAVDIPVENRAIGGRSTKSFMAEGRLDAIAADIQAGDTLLIQFGHNDASVNKPERFTPIPDYIANLKRYIDVARADGAQPVLLTPVTQRRFRDGRVVPGFPLYEAAVKQVAAAEKVPLIDLAAASRAWVAKAGEEGAKAYYLHYAEGKGGPGFPKGVDDDTHFSEAGARGVADIVARELKRLRLPVSRHVRTAVPMRTTGGSTCG